MVHWRLTLTLAAFTFVLAAALLVSARDGARADAIVEISALNISETPGDSSAPVGASSPFGHSIFAWVDTTPGAPTIFESHTVPGDGIPFSMAQAISGGGAAKPAVATAIETFVVTWLENDEVVARASHNAGQSWLDQVTLGPITGNAQPLVGINPVDANTVFAAWNNSDGAGGDVFITRSADGGQTWTPPILLGSTFVGIAPSLAVTSDGTAHVSVVTQPEIEIHEWLANQANPAIDTTFPYGARTARLFPAEGTDTGGVQLLFDTRAVPTAVLTAHRGPGGWADPLGLSTDGPARVPDFSTSGTTAVAVWEEGTLATSTIMAALSNDGGATFSAGLQVTLPAPPTFKPQVVTTEELVFVFFQQSSDGPTPTPPGTAQPEQGVAIAKQRSDELDAFVNLAYLINDDPVLDALSVLLTGHLGAGHRVATVPATQPVPVTLTTRQQEDTFADDVFIQPLSVMGDLDCNGEVEPPDALSMLAYLGDQAPPVCLDAANVNCSGGPPDTTDLLALLRYLGGLPYDAPDGCMPINLDVENS
jgi:hypothetical protein